VVTSHSSDELVRAENAKAGSIAWLPQRMRFQPGNTFDELVQGRVNWLDSGRSTAIEGYCSAPSVLAGRQMTIHVSTNPATEFNIDIYRLGYYGGLGARLITSLGPLPGITQTEPTPDAESRLVECRWKPSIEVTVADDWLSGVYLGKLTRCDDGNEHYVLFVVRDEREADIIVQCSDFTWQAYNRWPSAYSLYSNGRDNLTAYYGTEIAASFDRPYLSTTHFAPAVPGTGEYFVFEYPFTFWIESMGYDVTYCSNLDTHRGTALTSRAKAFLSVGHDEYWTRGVYDTLKATIDDGVSVGFFCGNSCCFEIDLRDGTGGKDRTISRKDRFRKSVRDGYVPHPDELEFRKQYPFPLEAPDDGALMGARNVWPVEGCGDWICSAPDHWVFEGTGMMEGEGIPNLVGHEWHGAPNDIPGLEIVSRGPTIESIGPGEYTATVYPGPSGNIVFNASTCWWGTGLAFPPGYQRPSWQGMPSALPDARVQRITQNVLDRMVHGASKADTQ
jgi:hypothetical protein